MNGSRTRVGIMGDLQLGLKSIFTRHQHRETCGFTTRSDSDKISSLVRVVVLRLLATFSSHAVDGGVSRTPSHIACTDTNSWSVRHT